MLKITSASESPSIGERAASTNDDGTSASESGERAASFSEDAAIASESVGEIPIREIPKPTHLKTRHLEES